MSEPLKSESHVVKRVCLWFIPYEPTDPEVLSADYDSEEHKGNFSHNFDYERLAKDEWRLHIDIAFDVLPIARIKVRSIIEIKCSKEKLLHQDTLYPINKFAIETAEKTFFDRCRENGIITNFSKLSIPDEKVKNIAPHMIAQFHTRFREAMSFPPWNVGGVNMTKGNKTLLSVIGTFIILDQVLHTNKLFALKHNQEVFHQIVPEAVYYTIKLIGMELNNGPIRYVFIHYGMFQICMDCAIQLLLDRHAETLQPSIIQQGLTIERQKIFVEYCSNRLRSYRDELKKAGSRIINLEERRDWNSLIM